MTALAKPLPDDAATLKAMLIAEREAHAAEAERLRQIIKALQRHRFGRRAETLPIDQLELALEDVEQVEAEGEAKAEVASPQRRAERARTRRSNRGSLPAHLPRVEIVVDVEDKMVMIARPLLSKLHRNSILRRWFRLDGVSRPE
jgi:transposase